MTASLACRLSVVPADCLAQKLGGVGELKLLLDAGAIGLHRFDADIQRLCDAPSLVALAEQAEDLQFPVAQLLDRRMQAREISLREAFGEDRMHSWTEIELSGQDIANSRRDAARRFAFHDVAPRAGAEGAFGIEALVMHREDDDGDGGKFRLETLDERQSGAFGQRKIDDGNVGLRGPNPLKCLFGTRRLSADLQIRELIEQCRQPFAHQRMIVNQKHFRDALVHEARRSSIVTGSWQITAVPPPARVAIRKVAPIKRARCAIMRRPMPLLAGGTDGIPVPSSSTRSSCPSSSVLSSMAMFRAAPCCTALRVPSWAIR